MSTDDDVTLKKSVRRDVVKHDDSIANCIYFTFPKFTPARVDSLAKFITDDKHTVLDVVL